MSRTESMEMYMETIYLIEVEHGHAHGVDIAKILGVSKASVSKAMNQLKNEGYINKEAYGSITLTSNGKDIAKRVYKKHQLISSFLKDTLKMTSKDIDENACRMEHVLTDEMLQAIEIYLKDNNINY